MGLIGRVVPDGAALDVAKARRGAGRSERAAFDDGDPAGVARDRAHERLRRDAAPGQDRMGGLRQRGRPGGPAGVRRRSARPNTRAARVYAKPHRDFLTRRLSQPGAGPARRRRAGADRRGDDCGGRRPAPSCSRSPRAVERLAARLGGGREDGPGYRPRSHGDYLPRSPVVGEASPLAPRLEWEIRSRSTVAGHRGARDLRRALRRPARLRARRHDRPRVRRGARHRQHRGRPSRA